MYISYYKGYVIITDEKTEKGIFFRSPIQKAAFDDYGNHHRNVWKYANSIKNPLRRFYEILIGNGKIVKNINKWVDELDFGGFRGNILCSPIYFKRECRKLTAISCGNHDIREIKSYGYESEFNNCDGACHMERTTIRMKHGRTVRCRGKEHFRYTYKHIVEEIIDSEEEA
jgi:hypothetical protein